MSSSTYEQQKMEKTFRATAKLIAEQYAETINGWMAPAFESCDHEKGVLTCSFPMRKEYANMNGELLNGFVYAMFDISMGALAGYYSGHMTPTISMTVSYLNPISVNSPVFVRAQMKQCGDTINNLFAEAFVESAHDTPFATATGTYLAKK